MKVCNMPGRKQARQIGAIARMESFKAGNAERRAIVIENTRANLSADPLSIRTKKNLRDMTGKVVASTARMLHRSGRIA